MPTVELIERARQSISLQRDIYIYGATDAEAANAVELMHQAGYRNVAQLRGGVAAWKAVGFPVERSGKH